MSSGFKQVWFTRRPRRCVFGKCSALVEPRRQLWEVAAPTEFSVHIFCFFFAIPTRLCLTGAVNQKNADARYAKRHRHCAGIPSASPRAHQCFRSHTSAFSARNSYSAVVAVARIAQKRDPTRQSEGACATAYLCMSTQFAEARLALIVTSCTTKTSR